MSQPIRGLLAEAATVMLSAAATKIAEQLIVARQQRLDEETNNVQLHSESKQTTETTREDSGLRIISD